MEEEAVTLQVHLARARGRTRLYRVTVLFGSEDPSLVAAQGYDPKAIDAHWLGRDGEWREVEEAETLRRLRSEAEDKRWS